MAAATTQAVGTRYVPNRNLLIPEDITVELIAGYRANPYGKGLEVRQTNLVFSEPPEIEILNGKDEPDEKVQRRVQRMMTQKKVRYPARMRETFKDGFWEGINIQNPVWVKGTGAAKPGELWLESLTSLDPSTFNRLPNGRDRYSKLLPGITLHPETLEEEFWQRVTKKGKIVSTEQLDSASLLVTRDPATRELAGEPMVLPLIPVFGLLSYGWGSITKNLGRQGAAPPFMLVENGSDADYEIAENALQNYSEDKGFVLPSNIKPFWPNPLDVSGLLAIVDALNRTIIEYSSPSSSIAKDGSLIGGSSVPEFDLLRAYLRSIHAWVCEPMTTLVQHYLDNNGYDDYQGRVFIPIKEPDRSTIQLQQAREGREAGTISPAEHREYIGREAVDPATLVEFKGEWDAIRPPVSSPSPLGFGPTLIENAQSHLDPLRKKAADQAFGGLSKATQSLAKDLAKTVRKPKPRKEA